MSRLEGSLALVTGASSGIGRASARALADRGCRLVVTGRDPDRLAQVAAETGGDAVTVDLLADTAVASIVEAVRRVGPPDLVVLNAGAGLVAPAAQSTHDRLHELWRLNVEAPVELSAAVLPEMCGRGSGRLVFVTSIAGLLGVAGESSYAATKAALHAYADSLRAELSGTGVGVTTVVPGVVDTAFFDRRGHPYARRFPRPVSAERVAAALVRAVERDRGQVVVPGWLRLPIAVKAVAPELYGRAAARAG